MKNTPNLPGFRGFGELGGRFITCSVDPREPGAAREVLREDMRNQRAPMMLQTQETPSPDICNQFQHGTDTNTCRGAGEGGKRCWRVFRMVAGLLKSP